MGVSTNIYGVWGIRLPYDDQFVEGDYEDKYDDPQAPQIIVDGMSGEYLILGVTLYDSGDMRYDMEDGDTYREIDTMTLPALEADYRARWLRTYPDHAHMINQPFKLIMFTHWS